MNAIVIVGLAWKVLKFVVNEPIVNKAMDNWTKGTSNKIDDAVWEIVERLAGITDSVELAAKASAEVTSLQTRYDNAVVDGTLKVMKDDATLWGTAEIRLGDFGNA